MKNLDNIIIPDYIESELNFIKKGILSFYLNNKLYFFYVSELEEIDLINQTDTVRLELDAILRDEFPSVRVIFTFYMNKLKVKTLDHFFSLESKEEKQHLQQVYKDKHIIFILYTGSEKHIKRYDIKNDDLILMEIVLSEIDAQVDKTTQFEDNKPSN